MASLGSPNRRRFGQIAVVVALAGCLIGVLLGVGPQAPPGAGNADDRCAFLDDRDATPFNSLGPSPAPNWNATFASGPVPWYTSDRIDDPDAVAAIQAAVETWENTIADSNIDFVYLGRTSRAAAAGATAAEAGAPDGLNVIGPDEGLLADGSAETVDLQLARGSFKGNDDSALEFDIEVNFDAGLPLGSAGVQTSAGTDGYDLESVVLHELGHVLGLWHMDDPDGQVMAGNLELGALRRTPQSLDTSCLRAMYDCSLARAACTVPPTPTPVFLGGTPIGG